MKIFLALFIQWFMSQATSNPADRKELQGVIQKGKPVKGRREQNKEVTLDKKVDWLSGWQGSIGQIIRVALIRESWLIELRFHFWEG